MDKLQVLLVEDDAHISNMDQELLTGNGYGVRAAYSGTEALLLLSLQRFDLVLLDLMLPGMPGEEVLAHIKQQTDIPVICISARDDVAVRVGLIRSGADDYLVKPFHNEELLARMEAVLRRSQPAHTPDAVCCFKNLTLNRDTLEVKVKGQQISLTKREYLILELLLSNPNKVFTKNNIFDAVWNEEYYTEDNTVNVHISNLRQKLKKADPDEQYIQTVWGIGFKMFL